MKTARLRYAHAPTRLLGLALIISGFGTACLNPAAPTLSPPADGAMTDWTHTLVELNVTRIDPDRMMPWRNATPSSVRGYAVAVGPALLITPSDLVRHQTLVELRLAGHGARISAHVVLDDPQSGLALIAPDDLKAAGLLRPLYVASDIRRDQPHTLVQMGAGDQVQRGAGTVTEIALDSASPLAPAILTFGIASDLRAGQPGTPVLREGRLAGLVLRYNEATATSIALAPDVIATFLAASRREPYVGPAAGGFEFLPLTDPIRRRYLNVPENDCGVQILAVRSGGTADGRLEPEDVLLAWDGHAVDNQGFYQDQAYGRLPLRHLIAGRGTVGGAVVAEIVRAGKAQRVTLTLRPNRDGDARVPDNAASDAADYLIDGGLLFRELTGDYLQAYGTRWPLKADARLVWQYLTAAGRTQAPGERVVVLSAVLPDPINIGYQNLRDEIVESINGHAISNLVQLAGIVKADGGVASMTLAGYPGVTLRLDANQLAIANFRIQRAYRIPSLSRISRSP